MHSCFLQLLEVLWQTCIILFVIGKIQATFHVVDVKMLDILNILKANVDLFYTENQYV